MTTFTCGATIPVSVPRNKPYSSKHEVVYETKTDLPS